MQVGSEPNRCLSWVRLAGPGRKVFILEITGSNPVPTTRKTEPHILLQPIAELYKEKVTFKWFDCYKPGGRRATKRKVSVHIWVVKRW